MSDLTRDERDAVLTEIDDTWNQQRGKSLTTQQLQTLGQQRKALTARYYGQLPQVPVGRCPFSGAVTRKRMDVYGLDGPWWDVDAPDQRAEGGAHLLTYLGALNFHGDPPASAAPRNTSEIQPGPEVPFVVPRLLRLPGVSCVISSRKLTDDQYTAYFIAYYADKPIPPEQSHQEWLRTSFYYTAANGKPAWNAANDEWDFDLDAWRQQPGKVWWAVPGDDGVMLRPGDAPDFPYAKLPGMRAPRSIRKGKSFPKALPGGPPIDPGD